MRVYYSLSHYYRTAQSNVRRTVVTILILTHVQVKALYYRKTYFETFMLPISRKNIYDPERKITVSLNMFPFRISRIIIPFQ